MQTAEIRAPFRAFCIQNAEIGDDGLDVEEADILGVAGDE
jgi:hypothetical protein